MRNVRWATLPALYAAVQMSAAGKIRAEFRREWVKICHKSATSLSALTGINCFDFALLERGRPWRE